MASSNRLSHQNKFGVPAKAPASKTIQKAPKLNQSQNQAGNAAMNRIDVKLGLNKQQKSFKGNSGQLQMQNNPARDFSENKQGNNAQLMLSNC